ncbi:hypothetical protein M3148_16200 [Georgenia satyanarayanai]|uniref:MinD/ParA family ATP-binding protein n=1 Tax=Georgenia satyanarayanai TaxID=860221 RepID=UPI00203A7196|nr:hypothetical protein [Georgenia satyanarayanai]MCM3662520.1 hypothetical protein [Georgenia satyanarayanai]
MSDLFRDARRALDFEEPEESEALVSGEVGVLEHAVSEAQPLDADADVPRAAPSPPASPPESAAVGLSGTARGELIRPGATERVRARWGWQGFMVRASGGVVRLGPGPGEQRFLDDERVIRQATWSRAVNILVGNKTGAVGKTTSSIVLAGVLGRVRGGATAAFEVSDATGALEKRAEGSPTRGMGELVRAAEHVASAGELAGYAAPQTSLAHTIGSVHDRPVLTGQDVRAAREVLDRYYRVTVADSGNNPHSDAFGAAVETADLLVVPTLLSSVAVLDAFDLLDVVSRRGEHGARLAESAVVVINHDGRPEDKDAVRRAREQLARLCEVIPTVDVLEVPYDPHIGRGGEITLGSLSRDSERAWTRVAATATRKLLENVN